MDQKNKVLEAIEEYTEAHHYSPSVRDLCKMTGIKSTSTMYGILKELKKCGEIDMQEKISRSITLL